MAIPPLTKRTLGFSFCLLLVIVLTAPCAHGDTFVYSITASQLLQGFAIADPGFGNNGYSDLYAQPNLTDFTIEPLSDPFETFNSTTGAPTSNWSTSTDFYPAEAVGNADLPWAHFFIDDSSSLPYVSLVSADGALLNQSYHPNADVTDGCGSYYYEGCWVNSHQVTTLLNGSGAANTANPVFTITITSALTVAALDKITWTWVDDEAVQGDDSNKAIAGYSFMTNSHGDVVVPEPASFELFGIAFAALAWLKVKKR